MTAQDLISNLQLQPHPEGGYYKETYRSAKTLCHEPEKVRNVCTAIYYLLEDQDMSVFHRIKSDELWFFHQGQALEIVSIQNGQLNTHLLGNDVAKGESPQAVIPANTWFAAKVKGEKGFSLVSCTVAPGFDFADFEIANRENLLAQFPDLRTSIEAFTW